MVERQVARIKKSFLKPSSAPEFGHDDLSVRLFPPNQVLLNGADGNLDKSKDQDQNPRSSFCPEFFVYIHVSLTFPDVQLKLHICIIFACFFEVWLTNCKSSNIRGIFCYHPSCSRPF